MVFSERPSIERSFLTPRDGSYAMLGPMQMCFFVKTKGLGIRLAYHTLSPIIMEVENGYI